MNKKEILEVLREMLADYEAGLSFKSVDVEFEFQSFDKFLESKNLDFGFCKWLKKSIFCNYEDQIVSILKTDFNSKINENGFWYPTSLGFCSMKQVKERSLMPRALHLFCTIERLEKEIIEDITVIMPQQI